jgi:hypothetical protein
MPSMSEIKPCPFCRCTNERSELPVVSYPRMHGFYNWYVRCLNCGAAGPDAPSRDEAVEKWNKGHDSQGRV